MKAGGLAIRALQIIFAIITIGLAAKVFHDFKHTIVVTLYAGKHSMDHWFHWFAILAAANALVAGLVGIATSLMGRRSHIASLPLDLIAMVLLIVAFGYFAKDIYDKRKWASHFYSADSLPSFFHGNTWRIYQAAAAFLFVTFLTTLAALIYDVATLGKSRDRKKSNTEVA